MNGNMNFALQNFVTFCVWLDAICKGPDYYKNLNRIVAAIYAFVGNYKSMFVLNSSGQSWLVNHP